MAVVEGRGRACKNIISLVETAMEQFEHVGNTCIVKLFIILLPSH